MIADFKKFLLQTNALALAIGVIIGAAIGKVVTSLVGDVMMPVIGLGLPAGGWRDLKWVLTTKPDGTPGNAVAYGAFLGNVVDFVIIAFVVYLITRAFLKPAREAPKPATKECPECKEIIPADARRCRACTSPVS